MRLPLLFLLPALASWQASPVNALEQGGLYPPGLLPLINRGNALLSAGQFSEAAKAYSEAIDQAPSDYLLYYKRATAYFSLQRHANALEDFEKVLSLTSNTFDNAHLMKARIYAKEGLYDLAKPSLKLYMKAKDKSREKDPDVEELEKDIQEGEELRKKVEQERKAELWTACAETASALLRKASHSIEVRTWRAECAFASSDLESAVGDLSRLSQILPPSTPLLTRIARMSYFFLAPSAGTMNTLKQCLHYDPDSKPCLALHRLVKSLDKSITKVEELLTNEDWRGVVKLLLTAGAGKKNGDVWQRWEDAMEEHVGKKENILPLVPLNMVQSALPEERRRTKHLVLERLPMPDAKKVSPIRQIFVRALCRSFTHLADASQGAEYKKQMGTWCDQLIALKGCEEDIDGLVGHAESLITKEAYTEAVQVLNKAFELSGNSNRSIHTRLLKAQKLLKQSKQKDYYKILGVSKDADAKTIKKAFRQMAKVAHPDKGGSEEKMAALNEAYEVLSDPEKRARVDAGEDPNDPNAGMGYGPGGFPFASYGGGGFGGGHPFAQYSQFFGGGGGGGGQGGFQFHYSHGGRRGP